jgi:N-acyl-D-aspartate/D-glutamate deacylase
VDWRVIALGGLAASLLGARAGAGQEPYDLLVRGGRLLDGSGNPWYYADVAVRGDRIAAVGDLAAATARRVLDARGLYVAPGFIDVHSHAGPGLATAELSGAVPLLAQGLTTVVINPDGGGPVDLRAQRADLLRYGLGVNVAQLVPHGSVRAAVLGMSDRAPSPAELDRMRRLVEQGMEAGAFGLSSGPFYAPGSYARTDELVELAKVASRYGGVYTSHIRDEADYSIGVVAAVDEVIRIARDAGLPGIVSHIKVLGPNVWGYSTAVIERIRRARDRGVQVFADQYAYDASSTSLTAALVPRWAQVGGDSALRGRLATPSERARIRQEMAENLERRGGAAQLMISRYRGDSTVEGHTLEAVARARGLDPLDAAIAIIEAGGAGVVSFNMLESDVERFMKQPWTMTCSDGDLVPMGEGVPHPRAYGAFPRKVRRYALDRQVISLEDAIRSMTSLPATVFHLEDRGAVRPGAFADLVVFDPRELRDLATYQQPHQLSQGMVYVLVNGKLAVDERKFTGGKYGVVLSRH